MTPEARSERARRAGKAAQAKKAAREAYAATLKEPSDAVEALLEPEAPPPAATRAADSVLDVFGDDPFAERSEGAPRELGHAEAYPEPQAEPVPARPVNWGGMHGRMARPKNELFKPYEAELEGPGQFGVRHPDAKLLARLPVAGTDMGAQRVYLTNQRVLDLVKVVRGPGAVPGPGDYLCVYEGHDNVAFLEVGE